MAKVGVDDISVFVGGVSLGGELTTLQVGSEVVLEGINGFGDSWVEPSHVGLSRAQASLAGFYDNSLSDGILELGGVGALCTCFAWSQVQGGDFSGFYILRSSYARQPGREELTKMAAEFLGNGRLDDGEIIQPSSAESGSGVTSAGSLDNGASTSNGGATYLQVSSLTLGGYTSITVTVQDSPNNSTWATLATHTVATSAPYAERISVSGTIDRYTRVILTLNGSGSSESITLFVGVARS